MKDSKNAPPDALRQQAPGEREPGVRDAGQTAPSQGAQQHSPAQDGADTPSPAPPKREGADAPGERQAQSKKPRRRPPQSRADAVPGEGLASSRTQKKAARLPAGGEGGAGPAVPRGKAAPQKGAGSLPGESAQKALEARAAPFERGAQERGKRPEPERTGPARPPRQQPPGQQAPQRGEPSGRSPAQSAGGRAEGPPGQQGCPPAGERLPGAQQPPQEAQPSGRDLMGEQLSRIRKLDPTVKGWEDVFSMPQYGEFSRLVQRGCTPVQAYQLACFERIMAQRVAAARRAAALAARGKAHLSPIPAAAGDCFAVPPEIHAQYRAFFPEWSEAQIRADYRRRC